MVMGEFTQETELLVLGGGPGGYAAAFRAADLGLDVTMVDMEGNPGGVCLFRGCIPSKTLLFASELLHDAARAGEMGITFGEPRIDLDKLRGWKDAVIERLSKGLLELANRRGVQLLRGSRRFRSFRPGAAGRFGNQPHQVSACRHRYGFFHTASSGRRLRKGGPDHGFHGGAAPTGRSQTAPGRGRRIRGGGTRVGLRLPGEPGHARGILRAAPGRCGQ